MVKRQKEKQYLSAREQRDNAQIRSGNTTNNGGTTNAPARRRLPFSHCALTLTPFTDPVGTKIIIQSSSSSGEKKKKTKNMIILFDNAAILPFLLKHKMDPVTGKKPSTSRDLIQVLMDRNEETGEWQCPILIKTFTDHSKIVAVLQPPERTMARVYSYEAYDELCVKPRSYEDLQSGVKFSPSEDVLILNDPDDDELNRRRDIDTFYHIQHARELEKEAEGGNNAASQVRHSATASRIIEQLQKNKEKKQQQTAEQEKEKARKKPDPSSTDETVDNPYKRLKILSSDVTGVAYTTGQSATSFTSTANTVHNATYDDGNKIAEREATQEEILLARFQVMRKRKRKGYVRLCTTLGDLTLELHCDIAPRTCTNFLGLCQRGSYNDTLFHRLIPNFMIQGGSIRRTKTGNGGGGDDENDASLWGDAPFADEFDDRLKHEGGGVVSMANAGPNTNRKQFFITFKSCQHLDRKHSVFGKVIKGMEVLKQLERIPTDSKKQRPKEDIVIRSTEVLADPAQEAQELELERLEKLVRARRQQKEGQATKKGKGNNNKTASKKNANAVEKTKPAVIEVGRYLKDRLKKKKDIVAASAQRSDANIAAAPASTIAPSRLSPPKETTFGDFSGW